MAAAAHKCRGPLGQLLNGLPGSYSTVRWKNLLKNFHLEDKIGQDKDEGKVVPNVPYKDGERE
jgi:hypothetical protein